MAARPWLTPADVRQYSEVPAVQGRADSRLTVDIARAEQYIIAYTHNSFADMEDLPDAVRTAALLLAEFYAQSAVSGGQTLKSETFDDYSYTAETAEISLASLDLAALLDDFVQVQPKCGVTMRVRRL
ncbi:MAG: DUF3199 family protein [Firmicutes bacterium]|nr:DUF3199 family protein [Bacillota bacterium]